MKKIYILLVFLVSFVYGFAQVDPNFPQPQNLGNSTSLVTARGALKVVNPLWFATTDTIHALATHEGMLCYKSSDKTFYWANGFYWQPLGGGGALTDIGVISPIRVHKGTGGAIDTLMMKATPGTVFYAGTDSFATNSTRFKFDYSTGLRVMGNVSLDSAHALLFIADNSGTPTQASISLENGALKGFKIVGADNGTAGYIQLDAPAAILPPSIQSLTAMEIISNSNISTPFKLSTAGNAGFWMASFNSLTSGNLLLVQDSNVVAMRMPYTLNLAIGPNAPHASLQLDVQSTTRAFAPPRMTGAQATTLEATTPPDGSMIYVTSTNGVFTAVGFWGRVSGTWTKMHL